MLRIARPARNSGCVEDDVAAGFPPEVAMRSAIIAARLARAAGADAAAERASLATTRLRSLR